MQRVAEFEKVSFGRFFIDMCDASPVPGDYSEQTLRSVYDSIELPSRATSGSAGYDFKAPFSFTLEPGETIKIPTGVRVRIDDGWWLGCFPRSGLGFKYRLQLDNTVGVIDSDYYGSNNEGHIFAKITNDGKGDKQLFVKAGDAFMQGAFIPYGITYHDDVQAVRDGGMGSTDHMNKAHTS